MSRLYRLPARRPAIPCIVTLDPEETVKQEADGSWVEGAFAFAAVDGLAKCIADEAVFAASQVYVERGLIRERFEHWATDAMHPIATKIAERLLHEKLIRRISDFRENPASAANLSRREMMIKLLTEDSHD